MTIAIAVAEEANPRQDNSEALRCAAAVRNALKNKGHGVHIVPISAADFAEDGRGIERKIASGGVDRVFNLFEGFSDDAAKEIEFARILERLGLPFSGNPSQALAVCLNKERCRTALSGAGLPVPWGRAVTTTAEIAAVTAAEISYPVFVKPLAEDASVGIDADAYCADPLHLPHLLQRKLAAFPGGVLVEQFIGGPEYSASFIGQSVLTMLAVSVIDYGRYPGLAPFLTYSSKWQRESREFQDIQPQVQAPDGQPWARSILEIARGIARALGCRGYFRVDLREMDGALYVIDVNPNPDINTDSGFANQARAAGYAYDDMIDLILKGADAS